MNVFLQWIRGHSSRFFHAFGIHCATHQIRLILISGLVITSLFYPALAIYTSSTPRPLVHLSSRLADSFFNPGVRPFFLEDDLSDIWSGYEALRVSDDSLARTRCGSESTVRIERLLLHSKTADDFGSINHQTLLSVLQLEKSLTSKLSNQKSSCLTSSNGECVTLSPLAFWDRDENVLLSDQDLLYTINRLQNLSDADLPIKIATVFAGRESSEKSETHVDSAAYLAITYFFREVDCLGTTGRIAWLRALSESTSQVSDIRIEKQQPWLLALDYDPMFKFSSHVSMITVMLYLSYAVFFVYSSGPMKRMVTVHSRVGLVITGLVEILVSTITSLSVCALAGLRITLIPWGIFPIVIVFVGAENMFRLIEDVANTSITLSVKERVGVGLSKAGTSNTLKVVLYNSILGIIAFFASGAIRQFCIFAIVVLVAHWFLIHTFFVAVLSIDLQRLELNDLIHQDRTLASFPEAKFAENKTTVKHRSNASRLIMASFRNYLRGRATKNFSLFLLLAITATLYYTTLPSSQFKDDLSQPLKHFSGKGSKVDWAKFDITSPAYHIWHILNPENDPLLHLRVEAPITVTFNPEDTNDTNERRLNRAFFSSRAMRPLLWLFKIMILPIGSTLSALYLILLYLLKDTELLEAQRNRPGPDECDPQPCPIEGQISFKTLPRASATDIEHMASNKKSTIIAYSNIDGELRIWFTSTKSHLVIDTAYIYLSGTSSTSTSSLTCLTMDDDGKYCAAGTDSGLIGIWQIEESGAKLLHLLYAEGLVSIVAQLVFLPNSIPQKVASSLGSLTKEGTIDILAVYEKGVVMRWSCCPIGGPSYTRVLASHAEFLVGAIVLPESKLYGPLISFINNDGSLQLCDVTQKELDIVLRIGDPHDLVSQIYACDVGFEKDRRLIVAATTQAGVLSLWDCDSLECIFTLDEIRGIISRIRLLSLPPKACPQCGELPIGNFIVASAVGHVIFFDSAQLVMRCLCPPNIPVIPKIQTTQDSTAGRRSRSNSFVSSSGALISQTRSRVPSFSDIHDTASFPVSGHGAHTRRHSEKDSSRRVSDRIDGSSLLSPIIDDDSNNNTDSVHDRPSNKSIAGLDSIRKNLRFTRLGKFTCERGGWDVVNDRIMGLRRKSRVREPPHQRTTVPSSSYSLSSTILERWEVWILDPLKGDDALQKSSLKDLCNSADDFSDNSRESVPRLPFTRLSPLLMKDSFCVAGFGNTAGILSFTVV